ncbi:MAG: hypothetical protein AAFP69_12390, partial [Planctomycetota bacterium]
DARRLITSVWFAESGTANESPDLDSLRASAAADEDAAALEQLGEDDLQAIQLYAAMLGDQRDEARRLFPQLLAAISPKSLLYIPLSRGGEPIKIFVARLRQRVLQHLLNWLPRCGMFFETCRLLETARMMEQSNPVGMGAVTEFDGLFRVACRSLVRGLTVGVDSHEESISSSSASSDTGADALLIELLEKLNEILLSSWLSHSKTLRLSALETVSDKTNWSQMVQFVSQYGDPIFTQAFLKLGNIRAILHQGVMTWLDRLVEDPEELDGCAMVEDLQDGKLSPMDAERWLSVVFESILDHHAEYLDYNSTTTQSDRGELVYMLLDFLRLRVRYDRIAWNLRPVMWSHEILLRDGFESAARQWRRTLSDRISGEADVYVSQLHTLQKQYAMRMPTVADRIHERFIQPMTADRMRALVLPAMRYAEHLTFGKSLLRGVNSETQRSSGMAIDDSVAFELLDRLVEQMTETPTGVGMELPGWLAGLDEEVERIATASDDENGVGDGLLTVPLHRTQLDDIERQLADAAKQGRRISYRSKD